MKYGKNTQLVVSDAQLKFRMSRVLGKYKNTKHQLSARNNYTQLPLFIGLPSCIGERRRHRFSFPKI